MQNGELYDVYGGCSIWSLCQEYQYLVKPENHVQTPLQPCSALEVRTSSCGVLIEAGGAYCPSRTLSCTLADSGESCLPGKTNTIAGKEHGKKQRSSVRRGLKGFLSDGG